MKSIEERTQSFPGSRTPLAAHSKLKSTNKTEGKMQHKTKTDNYLRTGNNIPLLWEEYKPAYELRAPEHPLFANEPSEEDDFIPYGYGDHERGAQKSFLNEDDEDEVNEEKLLEEEITRFAAEGGTQSHDELKYYPEKRKRAA